MKKYFATLGLALFLGTAAMAQPATAQPAQQPVAQDNPNAPEITFVKTVHDYGTVYKNGDGNCEFEFTNTGKEPLVLSNVRSSCGCTVPKWTREPILPGKSGSIKVKYDTRRMGSINKHITVLSNAKTASVVLKIKGKVVSPPAQGSPEKPAEQGATPQSK